MFENGQLLKVKEECKKNLWDENYRDRTIVYVGKVPDSLKPNMHCDKCDAVVNFMGDDYFSVAHSCDLEPCNPASTN